VAIASGAKTQVSSLVHGILVLLTLLFLMPLFRNLSHATLAAIVIEAMLGLANLSYFKNLRRSNPLEFYIAILAFWGVLFLGVLYGIGLGVIASILHLIHHASHPGAAVLGQIPHTEMYRNIALHPEGITVPGLLIFRFSNDIIFPNANYFRNKLKESIRESSTPVKMVLIDAETITMIDSTGMEMLDKVRLDLAKMGIILAWSRLRDTVRQEMAKARFEQAIGDENFYDRITDGVLAFNAR
jgi:MFS superfamily sulfate permease-like transporter